VVRRDEETLGKLSIKSDTTKAIRYALRRWEAVMRFCDDGHLEIDKSTTTRRNARYAQLFWEGRIICFMDRMLEANAQPRSGDLRPDRNSKAQWSEP
jgi:hypothetical protein